MIRAQSTARANVKLWRRQTRRAKHGEPRPRPRSAAAWRSRAAAGDAALIACAFNGRYPPSTQDLSAKPLILLSGYTGRHFFHWMVICRPPKRPPPMKHTHLRSRPAPARHARVAALSFASADMMEAGELQAAF